MKKYLFILFFACYAAGCASLSDQKGSLAINTPPEQKNAVAARPKGPARERAFAFGKTDFKGLLKVSYVRLLVARRDDLSKQYSFIFGSKANQNVLPWKEGRLIEPGYFYWHIPPGAYRITQIAIPVGTTMAEEEVAIDFEVRSGTVSYLGTLDVDGTKERVKFGGVPVMRPGFEYVITVRDEFDEALQVLKKRYADVRSAFKKELFRVN